MRARRLGVFTAVISMAGTLVVAAGPATPAGAVATDESYWVPVDEKLVVRGHGFGHGHGMSQYGAQGAALQGKSYREIADFYYPGTSWSKVKGRVRVLVSADTTDDVVVSPARGLTVRDLGNGRTYTLPVRAAIKRWRLHVRNGRTVVQRRTDRWRPFRPGGKRFLDGDGEFFANRPLTLWTPSGTRRYRGILRAASPRKGFAARDTVNVLRMDQYLKGVVPYEMPASWHPEAVKAQAVAARTYATWSRAQNRRRYYQICDTTACQVYGGRSAEDSRSNSAIDATRRQILTYGGKAAFTQFSSSSGGWTAKGSVPYLPAQRDPFDDWSGNPVHSWSTTVDAGRLEKQYPALGSLRRIQVVRRDGNGEWRGRVLSMVLDGSKNDVTITGDAFRWAFGLRSTWFTIEPTAIISRWVRIGGAASTVGGVRGPEYAVPRGAAQRFERGRIFYSRATGARELYGAILRGYRRYGGPSSALGLPRTTVRDLRKGKVAHFRGGSVYRHKRTGPVPVVGRIAKRYRKEGQLRSGLGWPTRSNYRVKGGQRVDFENGFIRWFRASDTTRVRITG